MTSHADARTCGKFILTGEHFILYDTPALVLPWHDAYFQLRRQPEARDSSGLDVTADVDELVRKAWSHARARLRLPSAPEGAFPFAITSTIPLGCGFGSSAALCVALLQAAAHEADHRWEQDALIAEATELESLFHGRSSGLDPTIVVVQQPLRFQRRQRLGDDGKGGDVETSWVPFSWTLDGYGFVLAVTRETRSTADAVGRVRRFSETHPSRFGEMVLAMQDLIGHIEALVAGRDAYADASASTRAARLGSLLTKNHEILREVGVSSPHLETLVEAALDAGALGAKLTGAGLGGGMLALAPLEDFDALQAALLQADARHCAICTPGGSSGEST